MRLDSLGRRIVPSQHAHKKRHGYFGTKVYEVWHSMKRRCTKPGDKGYQNYGGRGIKVCVRWMKFENFLADMGEPPAGMSLDRINNDGDYCPENCRWTTPKVQSNNRRPGNVHVLTFNGETMNASDWAKRLGISPQAMGHRLENWPLERALTQPPMPGNPRRKHG